MGARATLTIILLSVVASVAVGSGVLRAQSGEPNTQDIVITNGSASPSVLQVAVGASIRWVNHDTKSHELVLRFDDGFVLPLLDLQPGADFTMAFADNEALKFLSRNAPGVSGSIVIGSASPLPTYATVTAPTTRQNPSQPLSTTEPVIATTATPTATSAVAPTSIPTPPPPSAGGLGLVADGGPTGTLWLGFLGAAVMMLAMSALLHSGSRKRILIERKR